MVGESTGYRLAAEVNRQHSECVCTYIYTHTPNAADSLRPRDGIQWGRVREDGPPLIAKSDYPAGCLVPSSEYKLHYLITIFRKKFFQRHKKNYRKKYVFNVVFKIFLMCISCSLFFNTSRYNLT